jgi:hypothetical protein
MSKKFYRLCLRIERPLIRRPSAVLAPAAKDSFPPLLAKCACCSICAASLYDQGRLPALSCLSATTPNAARRPVGGDIRGSCSILSSGTSVCEQSVLLLRERQGPVRALNATFKSKMKCACRQFGMISLKNIGAIQYHSELMSCDGAVGSGIVITLGTSFRLLRQRCHQRLAVKVALADLPRQLFYRLVVVNRPLRCHRV